MRNDILFMWAITILGIAIIAFLVFRKILPLLKTRKSDELSADERDYEAYMKVKEERKKKGL